MFKKILFLLLFFNSTLLFCQKIEGDYFGFLNTGNVNLKIVFHLEIKNGVYIGTMDSPDQGAYGIKLNYVSSVEDSLILDLSSLGIIYRGKFLTEDSLEGVFKQTGIGSELILSRSKSPITKSPNRPQEPEGFTFYRQKEVEFVNNVDDVKLAGTLTFPRGKGPFPAVILVSGSGPQNRNSEFFNHKPFLVLADFFAKNGVAVLRYDDRGVGKSTGDFSSATTADFAFDAQAAFYFLKNQKKIDINKVGIIGHSEGGMIAPMVAAADTQVRFIVLLSAPGIRMDELMLKQTSEVARLSGLSEDEIKVTQELNRKFYDILLKEKENEIAKEKIDKIVRDHAASMPTDIANELIKEIPSLTRTMLTPWFRYFIRFNPESYLKQLNCPVLALNGSKDSQVSAIENLDGIRNSVKETNNKNVYTYIMPDLNHFFQHCEIGSIQEAMQIEETFSLEVMEIIRDWIKKTKFI